MHDQIQGRLDELKAEFERGKARLAELETEEDRLRETLLRISGAIQVLTEMLTDGEQPGEPA